MAVDEADAREFSEMSGRFDDDDEDDGADGADDASDDDNDADDADGEARGKDKAETNATGTAVDDVCDDASAASGMGAFVVGATPERIIVLSTDLALGIGW
jgi:hypothetical protein